ncbi:hypothetical protein D3C74_394110 [compost metagenome]
MNLHNISSIHRPSRCTIIFIQAKITVTLTNKLIRLVNNTDSKRNACWNTCNRINKAALLIHFKLLHRTCQYNRLPITVQHLRTGRAEKLPCSINIQMTITCITRVSLCISNGKVCLRLVRDRSICSYKLAGSIKRNGLIGLRIIHTQIR